jgi:hypothetical protein
VYVTVKVPVVTVVFILTAVVVAVETEVMTREFELPSRYPVPALTRITATKSVAATSLLIRVR